MSGRWTALVVLFLLAGCQTAPVAPVQPVASSVIDQQSIRERALGLDAQACAVPNWQMTGRIALSNGREGGSGRIEWLQGDGRLQVSLSAPVTRQSWTLSVDAGEATLDGLAGGPLHGADPEALVRTATGWEIPVAALGCWLRAVRAGSAYGPAVIDYDAEGRPARMQQGGWSIEYRDWRPDPASGLPMPGRIDAQRGADRIRLAVERWDAVLE